MVTCDEREVGRSGLEEEQTIFLINIIVNHDFLKVMDMNHFKNKLLFLSPTICGMVSVSTSLAFAPLSLLDSSLVSLIYRTLRENVYQLVIEYSQWFNCFQIYYTTFVLSYLCLIFYFSITSCASSYIFRNAQME